MEVYERVRHLRKEVLKLSQAAFGEKLGISRDVVNNIELNRLKNPEQKEPIFILICEKFGVSMDWLKFGAGDPLAPKDRNDELAKFFGEVLKDADDSERKRVLAVFAKMPSSLWSNLAAFAEAYADKNQSE